MQKRTNIQISSAIIILSILTIMIQFTTYYFFEAFYVIWGVSCLISILCCHLLLEQSASYEACFSYSLLTLFISLAIMVITFFGKTQSFLPYTGIMTGIAVINWLIPMLHCFLRYMLDYGTRIDDFTDFYRNTSIVFLLIYLSLLIYGAFARNAFPWAYPVEVTAFNLLPFSVIAGQIENYLYGYIPLSGIVVYLLSRILIFIPYGFFIRLLLRRQSRLMRFFALLMLPFLIELLQYIFIPVRCDIDDLIYAAAGAFIGSLSFFLLNLIFRAFTRRDFLAKDTDYRFSSNALHF